jgi:hypothetical protein
VGWPSQLESAEVVKNSDTHEVIMKTQCGISTVHLELELL